MCAPQSGGGGASAPMAAPPARVRHTARTKRHVTMPLHHLELITPQEHFKTLRGRGMIQAASSRYCAPRRSAGRGSTARRLVFPVAQINPCTPKIRLCAHELSHAKRLTGTKFYFLFPPPFWPVRRESSD